MKLGFKPIKLKYSWRFQLLSRILGKQYREFSYHSLTWNDTEQQKLSPKGHQQPQIHMHTRAHILIKEALAVLFLRIYDI